MQKTGGSHIIARQFAMSEMAVNGIVTWPTNAHKIIGNVYLGLALDTSIAMTHAFEDQFGNHMMNGDAFGRTT